MVEGRGLRVKMPVMKKNILGKKNRFYARYSPVADLQA